MTGMYDGLDSPVPVRCLGCALAQPGRHMCAGDRELRPGGGWCQCPEPGCGPNPTGRQRHSVGKPARNA